MSGSGHFGGAMQEPESGRMRSVLGKCCAVLEVGEEELA